MSPCLLAEQGGFLEQEGAVLGSVPHLCARRCCLPWAEVLCLTCAWPLVLALQHWGQRWGQSHTTTGLNSWAVLCHTSHCAQPCVPSSLQCHAGESRVHLYWNQQLFAWQSCRSHRRVSGLGQGTLSPVLQILASLHPCGTSPCCLLPGPGSFL